METRKANLYAIISLICGIAGLLLSCVKIGIIPSIVGIIISLICLAKNQKVSIMAIIGLVTSVLGVFLASLIIVISLPSNNTNDKAVTPTENNISTIDDSENDIDSAEIDESEEELAINEDDTASSNDETSPDDASSDDTNSNDTAPEPTTEPSPEPEETLHITMYATAPINVRNAPGTDSSTLETIAAGTEVCVINIEGDWAQIEYDSGTAYVATEYLTDDYDAFVATQAQESQTTAQEPQEDTNENVIMVWIPQSGSKYHRNSSCSGMHNPRQVTLDEAIQMGYEPCKRCY